MEGVSFITPMQLWSMGKMGGGLDETQTMPSLNAEASLFKDVFKNTVNQVRETQAHTLPIAEAKASLSLDVLITLRNKTLESYNELIKMNV